MGRVISDIQPQREGTTHTGVASARTELPDRQTVQRESKPAMLRKLITAGSTCLFLFACSPGDEPTAIEAPEGKSESPERIDSQNDPNRFQLTMIRNFAE